MLNQCILTGNLGHDPEVFFSSEGKPVASFSLAFRISKTKTGWIKVICFSRLAEVVEKYLHKGARIGVIGTLDYSRWETEQGKFVLGHKYLRFKFFTSSSGHTPPCNVY